MKSIVLKRILMLLPISIIIALISFTVMYFSPGNTAELILMHKNPIGGPDAALIAKYEKILGLNHSFGKLFCNWITNVFVGDFGNSFNTGIPVLKEFLDRCFYTFMLMIGATLVYVPLGFLMGILSAIYKNSILDHLVRAIAVINLSMPNFWVAIFLLWFFCIKLQLFPSFGYEGMQSMIIPSIAMGIGMTSTLSRVLRSCILECMSSAYVFTARSKGVKEVSILIKHILKNAMIPTITIIGMHTTSLLGGAVIMESIFGLPGIGGYLVQAIYLKDYPVISGFVFIIGIMVILINLIIDLLYITIDPRVRYDKNA